MHVQMAGLTCAKSRGSSGAVREMAEKMGAGLDSLVDVVGVACGNSSVITFILFSKTGDKVIN